MKNSISLFDAKAHFSGLVKNVVEKHETFIITKHGHAVAKLIPIEDEAPEDVRDVIEKMKKLGNEIGKTGLTLAAISALRDEGRE